MDEKAQRKLNRTLMAMTSFLSAGFIALNTALTIAAYNNVNQNNFTVDYQTDSIASYFDGGTGTTSDPYQIATAQQLRNLQKLNSLGFFNKNVAFKLTADITWDDATNPLLPIGSDDQPFEGTFDGMGHTITNLVVLGEETWDVGMFGYVAITGNIKNFFLTHPVVTVNANAGGGTSDTTNPLNTYFRSAAQQLPTPALPNGAGSGNITWTNGSASSTITGLPTTVSAAVNGVTATYTIEWESSDSTYLTGSGVNWHTVAATSGNATDLHTVMLTGRIHATVNGRVMYYTLERYEINVLGSGLITDETVPQTVGSTTTDMMAGIFKTIWPTDAAGGITTYHKTYVGFFIGHLDGNANYLGLVGGNSYNQDANGAIIVSGRVAKSSTCLIGRTRDDDVRDGTGTKKYGNTFYFDNDALTGTWDSTTDVTMLDAPEDNGNTGNYYLNHYDFGSTSYTGSQIYNSKTFSHYYIDSTDTSTYNYMRLYPKVRHVINQSYNIENADGTSSTVSGVQAVRFTKPLIGACSTNYFPVGYAYSSGGSSANEVSKLTTMENSHSTEFKADMNVVREYALSNGFWVYTKGDSSTKFQTLTGQNEFTLSFDIKYFATTSATNKTLNSWQILYNAWRTDGSSIRVFQPTTSPTTGFYYKQSTLQNVLWYDLANPYQPVQTYTESGDAGKQWGWEYQPVTYAEGQERQYDPVTIIADGYVHTAHVRVTVRQGADSSFLGAYYQASNSTDTWYPCFGIGFGQSGTWNCNHATASGTIVTGHDQVKNHYTVWDQPYLNVDSNTGYYADGVLRSQRGLEPSNLAYSGKSYDFSEESDDFFNSYFSLGGSDLNMNVLEFSSVFTNSEGNVSELMDNVDFLYNKNNCVFDANSDTFTTWNSSSDVKVGFDVTENLTSANSAAYYFYRDTTPVVGVRYTNATYKPTNTTGYKEATIGAA
jgi:hypothetical protein